MFPRGILGPWIILKWSQCSSAQTSGDTHHGWGMAQEQFGTQEVTWGMVIWYPIFGKFWLFGFYTTPYISIFQKIWAKNWFFHLFFGPRGVPGGPDGVKTGGKWFRNIFAHIWSPYTPTLDYFGVIFGSFWAYFDPILGYFWPKMDQFWGVRGPKRGPRGSKMAPKWPKMTRNDVKTL